MASLWPSAGVRSAARLTVRNALDGSLRFHRPSADLSPPSLPAHLLVFSPRQAHMQARFVILRVLLEAGGGLVSLQRTTGADGKPDAVISLDRGKIVAVGKAALERFLLKLQVGGRQTGSRGGPGWSHESGRWLAGRRKRRVDTGASLFPHGCPPAGAEVHGGRGGRPCALRGLLGGDGRRAPALPDPARHGASAQGSAQAVRASKHPPGR